MKHLAASDINLLHPADHPPPHGAKVLLYLYPSGTLTIGQWQHSGAALWAPMPRVSPELKLRLEAELEQSRLRRLHGHE